MWSTTTSFAAGLPVVTLDESGIPVESSVSHEEYASAFQTTLGAVHDSVMKALSRQHSSSKWRLSTVVVGVGVGASVGLGSVINLKAAPRFRVAFSNSKDPVLP